MSKFKIVDGIKLEIGRFIAGVGIALVAVTCFVVLALVLHK